MRSSILAVALCPVALVAAEPERRLALVAGKFGKALDAKATPTSVPGDDKYRRPPLTVECWAKLNSREGFNVLVSSDPKNSARHWEIYSYAGAGDLSAYFPGYEPAETRSSKVIADGQWHHVAMIFDGKAVKLYCDGKKVKDQALRPTDRLKPVDGALMFGQAVAPDHRVGCDGLIDDVRISNVVRSIDAIPNKELPHDPATVGLWRFDQDEGLKGDPAWTPPPSYDEHAEPWEKFTDKDWIDGRFRTMDTGSFLNATFEHPTWQGKARVFKGTAIRVGDKGEAAVIFDRNQLCLACGWTGDYLQHSDIRFGLLNTPKPAGQVAFSTSPQPGWAYPREALAIPATVPTAPLPRDWGRFKGILRSGTRTVLAYTVGDAGILESPWVESHDGLTVLTRSLEIGPSAHPLKLLAAEMPAAIKQQAIFGQELYAARDNNVWHVVAVSGDATAAIEEKNRLHLTIKPSGEPRTIKIVMGTTLAESLEGIAKLIKKSPAPAKPRGWPTPGPARWTEPIITKGTLGADDGPFAIDTLTIPYENPYKALFFVTALDYLPDGTIAICTCHGDVWLVKGADAKLEKLTWKRFATGLYQPLGLKVVDGKIVVLERGQLTRLHDTNADGEADFYENLNNDWHCSGGEHSFDTCLETDPQGNFYFFKTGDHDTPTGGCLMKVAKDGSKAEVFATGFRHPIGLGMSPNGMLTGADQEGNWMPATRIDVYQKAGFYGDMRTHHRPTPPKIYDPPLLWLPREADNSAGGQVWVPDGKWGPLSGQMLHLSYGRCRMLLVMPQTVGDVKQAGAVDFGLTFLSGVKTGRFNPADGHLYVVGLNGWQTGAKRDGCLQRVRYTDKPIRMTISLAVEKDGIRLGFSAALDRRNAEDLAAWKVEQWNYRWSADYGSRHWSVADPNRQGHDPVTVSAVTLAEDGKSIYVKLKDLGPVMQMKIAYALKSADGAKVEGKVFNTIHSVGK
jgi:hypothetical protein